MDGLTDAGKAELTGARTEGRRAGVRARGAGVCRPRAPPGSRLAAHTCPRALNGAPGAGGIRSWVSSAARAGPRPAPAPEPGSAGPLPGVTNGSAARLLSAPGGGRGRARRPGRWSQRAPGVPAWDFPGGWAGLPAASAPAATPLVSVSPPIPRVCVLRPAQPPLRAGPALLAGACRQPTRGRQPAGTALAARFPSPRSKRCRRHVKGL